MMMFMRLGSARRFWLGFLSALVMAVGAAWLVYFG